MTLCKMTILPTHYLITNSLFKPTNTNNPEREIFVYILANTNQPWVTLLMFIIEWTTTEDISEADAGLDAYPDDEEVVQ